MSDVASGQRGRLLAGREIVATLGPWRVQHDDERFLDGTATCHARARIVNPFLQAYATRLTVELDVGALVWSWSPVQVAGTDVLAIAVAGPPAVIERGDVRGEESFRRSE